MANKMQVIELNGAGGPEVMQLGARPVPQPGPGEVLIKVAAAGVNGPDLLQRRGHYPPPPGASDLLGLEVSGEIAALGDGVTGFAPGDPVCALTNGGGYAQFVCVQAGQVLPLPPDVEMVDAAGLPETFFTVWSNIFHGHDVAQGTTLLVHGGAGGIGSTAVQLGAAFGLKVYATAGSAENLSFCEALGATHAINHREEDFVDVLREAGGADIILDIVGGPYVARNMKAARPDARIIQLAFNQGSKIEVNLMPVMLKRLILTGSTLRSRPPEFKTAVAEGVAENIWPKFADGSVKPVTHTVLPLADASEAHRLMEARGHQGKILLTP